MTAQASNYLGRLIEITPGRFIAELDQPPSVTEDVDTVTTLAGQAGSHVLVAAPGGEILCHVTDTREVVTGPETRYCIGLLPLGENSDKGIFTRGLGRYPALGSGVYAAGSDQLRCIFESHTKSGLDLGRLSQHPELSVYADANVMFNRHLAILGQSGTGKSWTLSSIIQRSVAAMPKAHIILLDLHGEYVWRDADGQTHSAFAEGTYRHIDARNFEIPYWLLTYRELVDLLVDRNDPNSSLHISYLQEVILDLRRKANKHLGISRLSVDSPVYFSLDELYQTCKEENEHQLDFGKRQGPLFGIFNEFLMRFQSMYNDSRYDFLLRPKRHNQSEHLEALMRDFIGLGEPKRQITVVDLSAVPSDVRPTVTSQVARLTFEFNYWNPARREFPVVLVCEEAHQYIPSARSNRRDFGSSRQMERIAKEGRKYGVGLCVVSQRPTELSETVLSQCATFICMRTTNPQDQDYIRSLMAYGEQGLADVLSTLRRGEAIGVGEAVTLPMRFRLYPPNPPPAKSDVPIAEAWRSGPDDLDVADIVKRWWHQKR